MSKIINLIGKTYGRLTVISHAFQKNKITYWLCQCICGNEKITCSSSLNKGDTKSCGCLKKEKLKILHKTHGQSRTSTYRVWAHMIERCSNPNCSAYKNYGGRNIVVCKEWFTFEQFFHDMGEKPQKLTLERRNNDGNYCKENCYWANSQIQNNNKRNNYLLTLNNETKTMMQWSKIKNIPFGTLSARKKYGWSDERALETPLDNKWLNYKGVYKSVSQWARDKNISKVTLYSRLKKGWTLEQSLETPINKKYARR